jgi:hypothetical protein
MACEVEFTGLGPFVELFGHAILSFEKFPGHAFANDRPFASADGLAILGCYFPQRLAKSAFFESCMEAVKKTPDAIEGVFLAIAC